MKLTTLRSLGIASVLTLVVPALAAPANAQAANRPGSPDYARAAADVVAASNLIRVTENHDTGNQRHDYRSALGFLHDTLERINQAAGLDGIAVNGGAAAPVGTGSWLDRTNQLLADAHTQLSAHESNWHALQDRASASLLLRQAEKRMTEAATASH